MKTVATGTTPDDARQREEFLVKFVGPLEAEDITRAYEEMKTETRVLKHIPVRGGTTLESRMNSDVTTNFRISGGLSQLDGLHKIVPQGAVTQLQSWKSRHALGLHVTAHVRIRIFLQLCMCAMQACDWTRKLSW